MAWQQIKEKFNLAIYDSRDKVLKRMRIASIMVSLLAIGTLVYYYGFPTTAEERKPLLLIIQLSFLFYIIHYLIRVLYEFDPISYFKNSWPEAMMVGLIIIEGFNYNVYDTLIIQKIFRAFGISYVEHFTAIFIQVYLLISVGVQLGTPASIIPNFRLQPHNLFIISFVVMILGGAFLLMLPEMTNTEGSMPFIDALFMSTSATCVTGLQTVDTATYFTLKGQFILMLLVQFGGLNIITFGVFFAVFLRLGISVKQEMLDNYVGTDSLFTSGGILRQIILTCLFIEVGGAAILYFLWPQEIHYANTGEKIFFSVFHAVTAFNNAGLSIFTGGLYHPDLRFTYGIHICIAVLVFLGSLGLPALFDLFSMRALKERRLKPWITIRSSTAIALYGSLFLIVAGAILFYFIEMNNSLSPHSPIGKIVTSLFQSITPRTAGFSTVNIGVLSLPALVLLIGLMFIGGSSGSTAGGIKTSTFAILLLSVYGIIRGKKNLELFKRTIAYEMLDIAYAIFLFAVLLIFLSTFIMSVIEPNRRILDLAFEVVSAFNTVGLSTGITPYLSTAGKTVLILTMFIGRIGMLTIFFAMSRRVISTNYKYPKTNFLVG